MMESITHQPTAGVFHMTPMLVAELVEARHIIGHQGLPMLFLPMFYLSGLLKSSVDVEKMNNREELRTELDSAERARCKLDFFKRAFTEVHSESQLIESRTYVIVDVSRNYNALRLSGLHITFVRAAE
jgi:hypothetical protein